jgi:hypothetical protein
MQGVVGGQFAPRGEYLLWFLFDSRLPVQVRFKLGFGPAETKPPFHTVAYAGAISHRLDIPMHQQWSGIPPMHLEPEDLQQRSALKLAPGFPIGEFPLSR